MTVRASYPLSSQVIINVTQTMAFTESVSFHIVGHSLPSSRPLLATSELTSIMDISELDDVFSWIQFSHPNAKINQWFWFSRLIVPKGFVPRNAGVVLMKSTTDWADSQKYGIVDSLAPHGGGINSLTMKELSLFSILYGFKRVKSDLMVRLPSFKPQPLLV